MAKKRLDYIDGFKGLMCFMIMLGHFWNIYRGTSGASPLDHWFLDRITKMPGNSWILVASFWLYAFLIISGYLISFSRVQDVWDLLIRSVSRFLRLFIPILGACLIIYVIGETVGFHANETKEFFKSKWFQKYYRRDYEFADVFTQSMKAMFSGSCSFNSPFWVIRDMLVSSVLIYICKLVDQIFQRKTHLLPLAILLVALYLDNQVIMACFVGFLIGYYADAISKLTDKIWPFLLVSCLVYGVFRWLRAEKVLPKVFDKVMGYTLVHCFVLIALNRFSFLQRIFTTKPFLLAGKISFGVYAFHWPVICSVGSLVLIAGIRENWHPVSTIGASFAVSVAVTVVLSVIYLFTVEMFGDKVVGWVRKLGTRGKEK